MNEARKRIKKDRVRENEISIEDHIQDNPTPSILDDLIAVLSERGKKDAITLEDIQQAKEKGVARAGSRRAQRDS